MKTWCTLLLLLLPLMSDAQTANDICSLTTDGSARWEGLHATFAYSCSWKVEKTSVSEPQTFSLDIGDYGILQTIVVKRRNQPFTDTEVDKMMSPEGMKRLSGKARFLFGRHLKVDGMDCAEVATVVTKNLLITKLSVYTVSYFIPHDHHLVAVVFAITGEREDEIKRLFDQYKSLFLKLSLATDFQH